MSFKPEMIKDFKSSLNFLIDSMLETVTFISRGRVMPSKQSFAVQTEKFSSLYDKISTDDKLVENLAKKVVGPTFDKHSLSFLTKLVGSDGKVDDSFLILGEESEEDSFKLKTVPDGIYFQVSNVFLPVSEVYTQAAAVSKERKSEKLPFRNKILLGLYSCVYHSIKNATPKDQLDIFVENINVLKESLDVCSEVKNDGAKSGPMGMIQNLLGNIDFNQIGDMMSKVSGDERSSKEFADVFGQITKTIQDGGNPLEAMGDLIKKASMDAASQPEEAPVETTEESQPTQEVDNLITLDETASAQE